ncbi:hypothetical protein PAMP_023867 [Pampus punctatissimus]
MADIARRILNMGHHSALLLPSFSISWSRALWEAVQSHICCSASHYSAEMCRPPTAALIKQTDTSPSPSDDMGSLKWTLLVLMAEKVSHLVSVLKLTEPEFTRRRLILKIISFSTTVFVYLACAFRYGSEELDVIGLTCRKDIWIQRVQVYPPTDANSTKSPMQESLLKKVGEQGYPFSFQMPTNLPCSVALQPGPNDNGKACGVDFEVKGYIANVADSANEVIEKKDTCRLMIRKIQFAPANNKAGPRADITKQFMMSDKPVHLEASLGKEIYYHGDPITVNVKINNETTKVVKKIKVTVEQLTNVVLYSSDTYTKAVCTEEFGSQGEKEKQGILVSYKVKVNLMVSGGGDVTVELPLTLMSPKPAEQTSQLSPWKDEQQGKITALTENTEQRKSTPAKESIKCH